MKLNPKLTINNLQLTIDKIKRYRCQMSQPKARFATRRAGPPLAENVKCQMFPGQSLIEIIIAFGVLVVLAISLINASLLIQRSTRAAKNNTQATRLAQQSIEQIRVFRDRQGYGNVRSSPTNCYFIDTSAPDPLSWIQVRSVNPVCGESITLNNTDFIRNLTITDIGGNRKSVVVTVT